MKLWDKEPLKMVSSFSAAIYCWASHLALRVVFFPSEFPLEEARFSFAISYPLEIASGLKIEECAHVSFQL